ncbi:abortive infection family protein [Candidatus Electronema sp. PJ]|uniref:abortive infection family protein n=1 Tax=Candidatus Electronema sp. PJ TaxID=3401572 RepID=UPI003AA8C5F9
MKITQITRRDIADAIIVEQINWAGRLEEQEFLARLFDLSSLPSFDSRFKDASGDIWQHRINNPTDWDDDWIFSDSRFNLMGCDDELFLRFLCETIHPVVRPDVTEAEKLCQLYNSCLQHDGYQLVVKTRMSGKPVFTGRAVGVIGVPGIAAVKQVLNGIIDTSYVARQITRMESSVVNDPELAIGTAKELIETCCKTILQARSVEFPNNADLPQLAKLTSKELQLTPNDIPDAAKASDTIKRLLSNLATITQGIAELRNQYGTGHGRIGTAGGLTSRHAKLAVGAASTLAVFLVETHQLRK